jgi:hypothetical protein
MPEYSMASIAYDELASQGTKTFVYRDKPTPIFWPTEKLGKSIEGRQAHFAKQLEALRSHFGACIPIHICWASGERNQMDKGCIGHALGPNLPIRSVGVALDGEITHVILWETNAPNQ